MFSPESICAATVMMTNTHVKKNKKKTTKKKQQKKTQTKKKDNFHVNRSDQLCLYMIRFPRPRNLKRKAVKCKRFADFRTLSSQNKKRVI